MYAIGAVSLLSLLPLGRQFTGADATERASLAALGEVLLGVREAAAVAGVLAFSVGALLYSWLLYRSNLIPRWLSGWGIAALVPDDGGLPARPVQPESRDVIRDPGDRRSAFRRWSWRCG